MLRKMKLPNGNTKRNQRWCLLTLALLFFTAIQADAQCLSGDCKSGDGVFIFQNGDKYVGAFRKGKPEGKGVYFYTDGSRHHGSFVGGLPDGEGTKVKKDGERISGKWSRGSLIKKEQDVVTTSATSAELIAKGYGGRTGCVSGDCNNAKGVFIFTSGAIYSGEFKRGEINGFGVCHYPDGSKYTGEWRHRYPDGRGTKVWPNGRERSGKWKRGLPVNDRGDYLDPIEPAIQAGAAAIQSGCLRGNCNTGSGYFAYPDGSRYEGYFIDGQPHGNGVFYYPNGDRYDGGFRKGYRHGVGIWFPYAGKSQQGQWDNGRFLAVNRPSKGCINGNCQQGYGTYIFKEGDRYIGAFENGKPNGSGEVLYKNGDRYEGNMQNGAFQGYGTYYERSGNMHRGYWNNGTFVGQQAPGLPLARIPELPKLKVWSVLIGVSAYNHMPALRYPDDDAYRIHSFLRSMEGGSVPEEQIHILIDEDATKSNIKEAMRDLFLRAGPNDLVILYFSGHGLPGAFLPIDYDGVENMLYHEEIKEILEQSPAKYKLCLADACHSGSLLASRSGKLPSLLSKYYESLASADPGTALMMSSKSNETSLESSGLRQGVFSHYLLRGFNGEADLNGNKIVSVQELFNFVSSNVRAYTNQLQSPVMQGDYDPTMTVSVVR